MRETLNLRMVAPFPTLALSLTDWGYAMMKNHLFLSLVFCLMPSLIPAKTNSSMTLFNEPIHGDSITLPQGLTPEQKQAFIEKQMRNLPEGVVGHNIPSDMVEQITYPIDVRVLEGKKDSVIEILQALGISQFEITKVSPFMRVELKGRENDFRIETNSPEEQAIFERPAHWKFYVTPLKFGTLPITYSVYVLIERSPGGKEETFPYLVLEDSINVEVNYPHHLTTVANWFGTNGIAIFALILTYLTNSDKINRWSKKSWNGMRKPTGNRT